MTSPVCGLLCLVLALVLVLSEAQGTFPHSHRKVSSARPRASGVSPQVAPRLQSLRQRPNDAQHGPRNFQQQEPSRNHLIPRQQERNNAGRFNNSQLYWYSYFYFSKSFLVIFFDCFPFLFLFFKLELVFLQSLLTFIQLQLKRKFSWFIYLLNQHFDFLCLHPPPFV